MMLTGWAITQQLDMKYLQLTKGYQAIIDDDDFDDVGKYKWAARVSCDGRLVYAYRSVEKNGVKASVHLHRYLMGCVKGDGHIVDHINGDTLDNRRSNLRICDAAGSARNVGKSANPKSSIFKGVYNRNEAKSERWKAQIKVNRRLICLGTFGSEIEAARAYNRAALRYHGEFARLNPITE